MAEQKSGVDISNGDFVHAADDRHGRRHEGCGMIDRRQAFPPVIGLTGKRHVGKSTAADHLVEAYGFARAHPFEGGKVAAAAYFEHLGAQADIARRMAYGDLRDQPSPFLPGQALPRSFLEEFGHFMGVTLGHDWTLGAEMSIAWRREPGRPLIVESIIYEAPAIRAVGGKIVRIVRPDHDGPTGVKSDEAVAGLAVDATIVNDGDLSKLRRDIGRIAQGMVGGS